MNNSYPSSPQTYAAASPNPQRSASSSKRILPPAPLLTYSAHPPGSMSQLKQEDLRSLEQLRQRLLQLSQSIGSLKDNVLRTNPLPPWESIQNQALILAQNLQSITDHLSQNSDLLSRTVAYPSTNFPGRTQEHTLSLLLRKKVEPQVEIWMEEGRIWSAKSIGAEPGMQQNADPEEIWDFASKAIGDLVRETAVKVMRDNYTKEERRGVGVANVNTGLRVPPEDEEGDDEKDSDEEEEDDDDEDEEMDDGDSDGKGSGSKVPVIGARSLDDLVGFMTTGKMPGERG